MLFQNTTFDNISQRNKFRDYLEEWEFNWPSYQKLIITADGERVEELRKWCLEDLKSFYRIDLAIGKAKLLDLARAYFFTSYDAIIKKGFLNSGLRTPLHAINLTPIKDKTGSPAPPT